MYWECVVRRRGGIPQTIGKDQSCFRNWLGGSVDHSVVRKEDSFFRYT